MSTDIAPIAPIAPAEVVSSGLGPWPIFDDLIGREPEGSHVREVWGLGHRDLLADHALTPDAVHDPALDRVITAVRVISSTPTGSLMLDIGRARSLDMSQALARLRAQGGRQ